MKSTLVVMATGLGKTVVMANLAKRWTTGRIMILAHREELIFQARRQFEAWTGEDVDVEMGEYRADQTSFAQEARIVVSSVQTLNSKSKGEYRMARFRPDEFGLLFTDEAHHATADTYRRIYEHFGQNSDLCHVGVTATPDRGDKEALGQIFSSVACTYDLAWAIDNGYLVDLKQQFIRVDGLDLSNVKTRLGDLAQNELAAIMEEERVCHEVAYPVVDVCGDDRQAIVFTVSVAQAHKVAEIINRHRSGQAFALDGTTPKDERREMLAEFGRKQRRFLVNCQVATEGFDCPTVDVCAIARPTKSRALYAQMVGRITRPLPGVIDDLVLPEDRRNAILGSRKPNGIVLDYVGNSGRHTLCNTGDILGGNYTLQEIEEAGARAAKSGLAVSMREELERIRQEQREREERAKVAAAKRKYVAPEVRYSAVPVDPFSAIGGVSKRIPPWKAKRPASDKQQAALMRFGLPEGIVREMTMGYASNVLDKLVTRSRAGLATYKQACLLKKNGIDASEMSFEDASRRISLLSSSWGRK